MVIQCEMQSVIVVGAGPVGLLCALRLAKAGIKVKILEALPAVENSPRAMAYQPVAVKELDRAGILQDCRQIGSFGTKICWRKLNGEVIAELERNVTPENPYENLVIGQHMLAGIIVDHLARCESAEIVFDRRVIAIEQQAESVMVTTEMPDGSTEEHPAAYVVGADGGKSAVRKLIDIEWEGFTWPEQLVSCNVWYPFEKHGFYDADFVCDREHWALIANITRDGLWRVSYGDLGGLNEEELRERMDMKFNKLFPGPKPVEYKVEMFSPYRIHQRCASSFRSGRVFLAGDAAHLCNPFGGLGLTGGLLDAAALADSLIARLEGAGDEVLDQYATNRRSVFVDIVNPTSTANKKRLHHHDPDLLGETDPFLVTLRKADATEKQKIRGMATLAVGVQA